MSTGSFVLGIVNGMNIGLLAVGLVLIYKANRFINLAHAQLGTLSALLLAKWVLDWGLPWWLAFPVTVVLGAGLGLVVERAFVAPLRRRTSSPISFLLLGVGVSQLLLALTYIPFLGPSEEASSASLYPQPFSSDVELGGVVLLGTSLLTLTLAPLLVGGLAAFLRWSLLGRQIRAAASNPDAARLCGISIRRVSAVTWAVSGGLAAVSAVLQAPSQPSFNVASLGPALLMTALGAAALGAFTSLAAALGGGLLLGVLHQVVAAETGDANRATAVVFVTILVIVLARGRAIGRAFAGTGNLVEERHPVRVPEVLRAHPIVRRQNALLALTTFGLAAAMPLLPFFRTEGDRFLLVLVVVHAILGVSLTMLLGWSGQVSLGHFALVGVGAYTTARYQPDGWTLPALLLVAGILGAALMVVVGLPALRVRGMTLAVTTLGFAVIAPDWLFRQPWFGTGSIFGEPVEPPAFPGDLGKPSSQLGIFYVCLVVLALTLHLGSSLRRSAAGRLVIAVRDNEAATNAFGMAAPGVKLAMLGVSGFFAAVAGVLWASAYGNVAVTQFGPEASVAILSMPVIGGLGSLAGAAAAAVVVYLPAYFFAPFVSDLFGSFGNGVGFQLFLAGGAVVMTLLNYPLGIAGAAQGGWEAVLSRWAAKQSSRPRGSLPDALPLVTSGVRLNFGGVRALDGPDIEVRAGEIVGLIGPNGAGKTTLMNVVSGVLRPQQGSVQVFGNEVVDLPADFRGAYGVARSFQDARLFPGLTVTEVIQVALSRTRRAGFVSSMLSAPWVRSTERELRDRADDIIDRFGLRPWADVPTGDLSTGTRRICDLAAQVAAGPRLLLLDEPTGGVAQREAEAFGPLLRRIRDELDCSILIIEHDMPLLMGLCDRVYAMELGRVIAEGTPAEIRADAAVISSYLGTDDVSIGRSGTEGRRRSRPLRPAADTTETTAAGRSR